MTTGHSAEFHRHGVCPVEGSFRLRGPLPSRPLVQPLVMPRESNRCRHRSAVATVLCGMVTIGCAAGVALTDLRAGSNRQFTAPGEPRPTGVLAFLKPAPRADPTCDNIVFSRDGKLLAASGSTT